MTTLTPQSRAAGRSAASGLPARLTARGVLLVVIAAFVLFFAIPIVWLLFATTKTPQALLLQNPFALGTWSQLVANWNQLIGFQGGAFAGWFANSALYSVCALALTLIVSIPAGYALALTEFRLRRAMLIATLIVMLVPNTALVLPIFLELNTVGLIGNALSVILPFSFFPFGVYLTYIYFSTSVPRELLAAARIDGCNEVQVFLRVAMPLATPVIALVGFFSFVQNWNNYFLPFVMLPSSSQYPLPLGLTALLATTPSFNPSALGSASIELPTLALATVLSVAPVLLVFLFSQRFLVAGMTAGGTKE